MSYVFSSTTPPLLKDYPAILSVPPELLQGPIHVSLPGEQPNSPAVNTDSQHDHWQTYSSFILRRYQVWRLNAPPFHSASEGFHSHSVTTGYEQTKMTEFVKTISATAGAEGFGMTASVTASLQLTTQDTQSWSASVTDVIQSAVAAGTNYVSWTLFEHLEVESQLWYQYEYKGADPPGYTKQGGPTVTFIEVAILNFDDACADATAEFIPSTGALLAHTGGSLHPA